MNRNKKPDSLLAWLDQTPPFWVYYLSHEGKNRLTYGEMAKRGGLTTRTFLRLTGRLTWANVTASQIDGFCRGCGIDLMHFGKHRNYLAAAVKNGSAYHYLSQKQGKRFRELSIRWRAARASGEPKHPRQSS